MRQVVHWDGDNFFASIEQACDRRLRGRPVAVGGARRGIVVSASREARRFGIRPGMSMWRARRACPRLVTLPGQFDLYEQFSSQILGLCDDETPLVEPVSVGAAYLDLTGSQRLHHQNPAESVSRLRRTVNDWLRVSISAGIATNKTVARIAARLRKPGAQLVVAPGEEAGFLAPLPISWLPEVGPERQSTLEVAGLTSIGDLARAPLDALGLALGRDALRLQRRAQGIDEDPVRPKQEYDNPLKESLDFSEDICDESFVVDKLKYLLECLMVQVRARCIEVRRLSLALRYTDRERSEHSLNLTEPSALDADFLPLLPLLLRSAWSRRVRLRSISLRAGRIYRPSSQMELFAGDKTANAMSLQNTIDRLRQSFGPGAVIRGYAIRCSM
jgi:DNA polymerase-4